MSIYSSDELKDEIEVFGEQQENVHFMSKKMDWETPQWLFDELHAEFGFDVDVCASPGAEKRPWYYSPNRDGLKQSWCYDWPLHAPVCWMNPPYGREIIHWMKKAYEESQKGCAVVCLVPSRTDTKWWHEYAMKADEIRYIRGRLKFGGSKNSAPFPSAIVIFRGAE